MGVKGFATWLARTYPECFVPQQQQEDEQQGGGKRGGGAAASSTSAAGRRPDWASRPSELPSSSLSSSRPVAPASFDHVYVDMASLLHTALRQAKSEGHFAILIFSRLDALLRDTRPRRSVVLALDGPAPLAKLLTQRLRRKRAGRKATRAEEAEAEEFLSAAADDDDAPPSPSGSLNSLHLTPGSPLMRFVADALEYFICARLEGSAALKRVQWELSGADVPGEGELKLLSRLRSHWWGPADGEGVGGEGRAASTGSSSSSSDEDDEGEGEGGGGPPRPGSRRRFLGARRGESHCVVGGDSDLLLMASLADARGPVFVMADSKPAAGLPPQGGGGASSSGRGGGSRGGGRGGGRGRGGERTWRRVFSVDALDAAIARDLGLGPGPLASAPDGLSAPSSPPRLQRQQQRQQQQQQLRRRQQLLAARTDLVLLSIVSSGNDYLPPVHGIDLKASWAAYRAVVRGRWSGGGGDGGEGGSGGGEEGPSAASPSPPPLPLPPRVSAIVVPPPSGPGGGTASIDPELLAVVLRAGATARGWRPRRGGNKKKGSPGGGGGGGDGDEESPPSLSDDDDNAGDLDGDFRPACDPAAYLRGAAWVLGMYCTGVCADWRFCYDARGPGVEELLAELEAEAARKKKERESFAAGLPPSPPPPLSYSLSRKSPPLAPAVCAAALLPPGPAGAAAAPAPLRGLWDVSSSPAAAASAATATAATKGGDDEKEKVKARDPALVELFTVCDACESLSERSGAAQGALLAALGAKKRLEQEEADAKAAPSPQSSSPETTAAAAAAAALAAEAVDLAVSAAKDAVRAVNRARNTHVRAAHPYAPFPLEKLERAVEEALLRGGDGGGKGGHRAALLAFGRPRRYWRCAEAESYYSNNARAAAAARAVVSRSVPVPFRPLPSPPSSRLRILEPCVKRPIVREELPEEVVLSSPSDGNGTGGGSRSRSKSRVLEKAKEEGAGSAAPPPVPAAAAATARAAGAVSSRGRGRAPRAAPRAPKALLVTAATAAAAATAPLPLPPHRRRPLFSACASVRRLPCSSPRLPW